MIPSLAQGRPLQGTALQQREICCTHAARREAPPLLATQAASKSARDTGQARLEELGYHQELQRRFRV